MSKARGGTNAEKIVKVIGKVQMPEAVKAQLIKGTEEAQQAKVKVSTNGREKRAAFIQTWGKKIVELWGANKKSITEVVKRVPGINSWQIDYALCKLGAKKTTSKGILQWCKDDEVVTSKVVKAQKVTQPALAGMRAEVVQFQKIKPKALITREKKEAESVARFHATEAQVKNA